MKLIFTSQYANLLLFANGLAILFYIGAKKKKRQRAMKFGNYETLQKVAGKNFLKSSNILLITRMLALTCLIVGISNPVLQQELPSTDTDYVLAVDSSSSMLASDMEPTRFEAAKSVSADFVNQLSNRTEVGVISFAGEVNRETDPVADKPLVKSKIENLSTGSTAGTAIGDAIYAGSSMLIGSNQSQKVILITDGRNNVGSSINDSADFAESNNVTLNAIGIGRQNNSEQQEYGVVEGNNATQAEYPNLDIQELYHATNQTGGKLVTVSNRTDFEDAFLNFEQNKVRSDISIYFIFAALFLMLIEWVLGTTRFSILP